MNGAEGLDKKRVGPSAGSNRADGTGRGSRKPKEDLVDDEMTGLDAVDLKILSSLRAVPDEPLKSVAGEVMERMGARQRHVALFRWATAVAAACLAGLGVNALGPGMSSYMYGLLLHGDTRLGGLAALAKIMGVLRDAIGTIALKFVQGAIGYDLSPYALQILSAVLGGVVVVILVMYLMGRWLSKPKEGKSWLLGRSLHNGLQVW